MPRYGPLKDMLKLIDFKLVKPFRPQLILCSRRTLVFKKSFAMMPSCRSNPTIFSEREISEKKINGNQEPWQCCGTSALAFNSF